MNLKPLFFLLIMGAALPVFATSKPAVDDREISPIITEAPVQQQPDAPGPSSQPVPLFSRGRMLYENHCTTCHESNIHIRARRKAKNFNDVTRWVIQRSQWLKLNWSDSEIVDVTQYINGRFYKYKKP